ncbi:phage-related antirepressor [Fructilactobacillus fructivorans]|nr:phage regulatory protein/antirepressor Ant [Fructilactobacillus fructivorans]KRN13331.1 phage-related antirepressor [Fructilactobacillus fructivorans]
MKNKQAVTTSLKVASKFDKRHDNVMRAIGNLKKDLHNFEEMFIKGTALDTYGRSRNIYYMNRDGFTFLAMGFTGSKAMNFKAEYIKAFNQMEDEIKHTGGFNIPKTKAEALQLATDQQKKIDQLEPKARFSDAVTTSNTTILIGELAKMMKQNGIDIGQNKLFSWLRNNGYLIRRFGSSYNTPTQKAMRLQLFKIKESTVIHSDGHSSINKTTKVTGKGQKYFINKFLQVRDELNA